MNRIGLSVLLVFLFIPGFLKGFQDETAVAWIDNEPLYSGEFLYAFNKNRKKNEPVNEDSLLTYLDQYINFKLKVLAATLSGTDTTKKFQKEYHSYINEIKKPYLQNPNFNEQLIREAHERLQYEIRAAHILVRLPKNASPKDTLNAFNQISSIRARAVAGEDFGELAKKNSQDGSAPSGGDLGYFTGFSMVYPFESAAFKTTVAKISDVVRTQFGYHLLKVIDKRPARGRVKTAHIFVSNANKSATRAFELIEMAYDSLQNGGDWRAVCTTFSEDSRTKTSGGSLPYYGVGQFPEPLLNTAFSLERVGEFSKPVQSSFGWHILKLESKEPVKSLEELRGDIANRVRRSGRNQLDKKGLVKKLKIENTFHQDTSQINLVINNILLEESDWPDPSDAKLFTIGDKSVLDADFIEYLNSKFPSPINVRANIWQIYEEFEYLEITSYEDQLIPKKYPEHEHLINEYRQGLLLFEIMEKQVWNKALEDSIGLEDFYKSQIKDYASPERAAVFVIEADSLRAFQEAYSLLESKETNGIISPDKYLEQNMSEPLYQLLKIVKRRFEQKDLPNFAGTAWKSGSLVSKPELLTLYWVQEIIDPGYYKLNEIKGLVISDYQDFLEKRWIRKLRKMHKVKINKKGIKTIVSGLE